MLFIIRALLSELLVPVPAVISMEAIFDRSESHWELVHDVKFTVVITIVLVIAVIFWVMTLFFIFAHAFSHAHSRPGVQLPDVSLFVAGTCGVMYFIMFP